MRRLVLFVVVIVVLAAVVGFLLFHFAGGNRENAGNAQTPAGSAQPAPTTS